MTDDESLRVGDDRRRELAGRRTTDDESLRVGA
jgi:hypothetical protein